MKIFPLLLTIFLVTRLQAQQVILTGDMMDDAGNMLSFASVALLHPDDSTLAYFGMTNEQGHFEIKNVGQGKYLLQAALLGYQTRYKNVELPLSNGNNIGTLIMPLSPITLGDVNVTGERIPMLIKNDTVEYDAGAYKTKPDAVAEDLLKKLPGVQVDRAGNIKAQGEDVNQVLVDGKEFFGTDPKVATKNLPADAIKKVQVFDKKSDEAELTGIDDGTRNKTINLLLKDNKKSAYFGDVMAGGGTGGHYQADAKLYRFTKKSQFAALGMLNNINQFGFTFKDYIDFSGGIQNFMSGNGRVTMGGEGDDFPINFGQPVTGLITSGAGGLNYTYEPKKDNRFNISYLGDGADKQLNESVYTQNFTNTTSFTTNETNDQHSTSFNHRFNAGWRWKPDSTQTLIASGNAQLPNGKKSGNSFTQSFSGDTLLNSLSSVSGNKNNIASGNGKATYLKRWDGDWRLFKLYGDISASHSLLKSEWNNITHLFATGEEFTDDQFQNDQNDLLKYNLTTSVTRRLATSFYLVPAMDAGAINESLLRKQGIPPGEDNTIDSLNADFKRTYHYVRPGISFRKSTEKIQFNIGTYFEAGKMNNTLDNEGEVTHNGFHFLPQASWEDQYKTGRRLMLFYESKVNTPSANQLLPVLNNSNPLQLYYGNRNLLPEYEHDLQFHWMYFDQFSFTSFFIGMNGSYVYDKINWSRSVSSDLAQVLTLLNVPYDYSASANLDFSTPIRKLGVTFNLKANESWERGINYVNDVENINTNLMHKLTVSVDNRKKEKWDVSVGAGAELSNALYSVQQSLNNRYFNLSFFTDIRYTPNEHWYFSLSADITNYNAKSFNETVFIPLVSAEISRYLLKNNRGVITFNASDLLNKNTGIDRYSELNYLRETQSNIIGRYFMISFKYRLNKFDDSKSGVNVEVNKR